MQLHERRRQAESAAEKTAGLHSGQSADRLTLSWLFDCSWLRPVVSKLGEEAVGAGLDTGAEISGGGRGGQDENALVPPDSEYVAEQKSCLPGCSN